MSTFEVFERQRIKELKRDWRPAWAKCKMARQCSSKRRFKDIEQAKTVKRFYPNMRIYECKYCNGYHLTKNLAINEAASFPVKFL